MGMFDYVNYEMKCPTCGELVNGFQTKDFGGSLAKLETREVSNFYDICKKCHTWIEFDRKIKLEEKVEDAFDMTVKKKEG